jgi:pimeloyl-ACP methyl ester carboxylesterase
MRQRSSELAAQINSWDQTDAPDKIVLIGFSMGGLLVRCAYLFHAGGDEEARRTWVDKVERIVLLGTPNAGFERRRLPILLRMVFSLARIFTSLTVFDVERGSPFITDLRLRWVRYFADPSHQLLPVVQLLGARDSLVRREDSLDIEAMPFAQHEYVPDSTHTTIADITDAAHGDERYRFLRAAVLDPVRPTVPPEQMTEEERRRPVVFVLHGIRAGKGNWVKKLKAVLEEREERPVVITPSYGYFSAMSFALPYRRVSNLRWFLDRYNEEVLRRPQATISIAGHSNGTYILGKALAAVRSLRFGNVYLAGSVLPRTYDWSTHFSDAQVRALRNDCASQDVPVLWLCSALVSLGQHDVGTAGVDGFDDIDDRALEYAYVPGGHAAALDDPRLPDVAIFLMTGTSNQPTGLVESVSPRFALIGRVLKVMTFFVVLALLGLVGWWIKAGPVALHAGIVAAVAFVIWVGLRVA